MSAKFKVSEEALVVRINRRLKRDGEAVRKPRGARTRLDLGDYYILNTSMNVVSATFVNIEALGRELKMLGDHEQVEYSA